MKSKAKTRLTDQEQTNRTVINSFGKKHKMRFQVVEDNDGNRYLRAKRLGWMGGMFAKWEDVCRLNTYAMGGELSFTERHLRQHCEVQGILPPTGLTKYRQ